MVLLYLSFGARISYTNKYKNKKMLIFTRVQENDFLLSVPIYDFETKKTFYAPRIFG